MKQPVTYKAMETRSTFEISLPSIIIAGAIILSTIIGASTFYRAKSLENSLSVTGSARQEITSDQVKWVGRFERQVLASALTAGYAQMAADLDKTKAFYQNQGIDPSTLIVSPVAMEQVWKQNDSSEKEYILRQTVELNSGDVALIDTVSKNVRSLIEQGVVFSTASLEYSYSKLPELRVSLLADALKDAQARARTIAETSGGSLGKLKAASSGVVQVLPLNSLDVSDYGAYDTQNIKKQVMVTVKAAFEVR